MPRPRLEWLEYFDKEDLIEMVSEVIEIMEDEDVNPEGKVDNIDAIIYEWRESYLVANSGILDEAFSQPSDPVPLTPPWEIEKAIARMKKRG